MTAILDRTIGGRHIRILSLDCSDPQHILIIDGAVHTGFASRLDALAAARRLMPS
jgi:hypothetical protein